MITIDLTNTNPMIMTGEATTSQQTMYFRPDIVFRPTFNNVCSKFVNPVCYLNKVFGNISDLNNDVENDQTSFLFSKVISTDVVAMELWSEEDGKLADLIDDSYGTFYDVGFSSIYPLYFGYRIHWGKVLNAFGSGHYYLKVVGTFIGEATTYETQCFYLLPFSNCNADGTVRIKWFQDGDIGSNSIKYAGLNWENWIRIPAIFWNNEPTEEIDEIEYTSRKFENVQIRSIDEFSLDVKSVPFWVTEILDKNVCLATAIEVTDYNADNHRDDLINYEVRFSGYGDRDEQRGNKLIRVSYKFKKRIDNDLKREYPRP